MRWGINSSSLLGENRLMKQERLYNHRVLYNQKKVEKIFLLCLQYMIFDHYSLGKGSCVSLKVVAFSLSM